MHIAANRLLNQSMSCIEYSVGRFECRDFLCRIIDKTGLNVFKLEQVHLNGPGLLYNYDLTAYAPQIMQNMADAQHPIC